MTPEGVEVRGTSIRIWFLYRGKRCKETLKGWKATPANIRKAGRLRAVIVSEISDGTFDYLARFPNSKRALELGNVESLGRSMTVKALFERWLKTKESINTQTTIRSKRHIALTCTRLLGEEKLVVNVNYEDALKFRHELLTGEKSYKRIAGVKGRASSTVNAYMSICSEVWNFSKKSGYLENNPFEKIKGLPIDGREPDPLEYNEFSRLINHPAIKAHERNLWTVAIYTGLRHGEICALAWEDIDLEKGMLYVSRNLTSGGYFKLPKTKSGERTITLLQPAIDALKSQKAITFLRSAHEISVQQREPGKTRHERCHWVFLTRNGSHYSKHGLSSMWNSCMRRTGIRRRSPYQTRHSYACWMLTEGANPSWIASQMGHKNATLVLTTYGKFMPSRSVDQANYLNQRLAAVSHTCPIDESYSRKNQAGRGSEE
ncbi:site-specific integrase [Salinivibrio sp. KP-1]|uniref:site-specific integrase n=1 Tax=Salinivibrio sp. KP-1 TaxID=1406902 RepID=UPI0006978AED|nr:site-specific integrase [Salinivibrio sp. KP-1]